MMHINNVMAAVAAYIDEDMVPQMPKVQGITFAAFAPFIIKSKLTSVLIVANGTELVDGENINIEAAYREFKAKAAGKWPLSLAGFDFTENDLDKLYRYLMR